MANLAEMVIEDPPLVTSAAMPTPIRATSRAATITGSRRAAPTGILFRADAVTAGTPLAD